MYVDDNRDRFTPRDKTNRWTTLLQPTFRDFRILKCPSELTNTPATFGNTVFPSNSVPADFAWRSYIINGWNDYFGGPVDNPGILEAVIHEPSDTVLFGEKDRDSGHYYMDYDAWDDEKQLDQTKHSADVRFANSGGSDYAFTDGSARFLKWGKAFSPVNLWAVTDLRTNSPPP